MEYYGYKDRGEAGNPIVDWGKIASDLTANLTKIEEGREAKRKEIDEVTQGFVDEIGKVDFGHSQSMGTFIQDSANSTKQYTLLQQKLLKQGKIDPNQYKMNLQNQKDSWSSFTNVTKNWNANYDRFVDMQAKGLVGQQAADQMELLGNMQNFQNKKSFIDPASGNLYVAEYDKNGNIDTTKFQPQSATGMFKIMGDIPVKVNVTAEVAKNSKIAEFKKMTAGMMVSDPTARPEYTKMADQVANSVLSTDRAIGSVLMDTVGGYTTTYQPDPSKYSAEEKAAAKAGKLIVYKRDGTGNYNPADFTPAQMEEAKKAVKDNLRSQLGYEAEPIKTTGGGGGSGGGLTAGQQLEYEAGLPNIGTVTTDKNPAWKKKYGKDKKVVAIDNASFSIGKSGDVRNIKEMGYSPEKGLYIKYDEYTKVQNKDDFTTGIKRGEYTVLEDNSKFSVLLQRLGDRGKIAVQGLRSGSAAAATKSSSYKIKGKTYTLKQLQDMGYTEEDVKSYKI